MTRLGISGKKRNFDAKMMQLLAFAEHAGLLMGGGWDLKKATAEFFPAPHNERCCSGFPALKRITPAIKAKVVQFCRERGLVAVWSSR